MSRNKNEDDYGAENGCSTAILGVAIFITLLFVLITIYVLYRHSLGGMMVGGLLLGITPVIPDQSSAFLAVIDGNIRLSANDIKLYVETKFQRLTMVFVLLWLISIVFGSVALFVCVMN